jgi:transcriptional regulator with XRE-family HTH domain
MNIDHEDCITGEVARALRKAAKLTQREFWLGIGVNQTSGCRYETDKFAREHIPRPVRILLLLKYVIGVPIDLSNANWRVELTKLAQLSKSASTNAQQPVAIQHHPV